MISFRKYYNRTTFTSFLEEQPLLNPNSNEPRYLLTNERTFFWQTADAQTFQRESSTSPNINAEIQLASYFSQLAKTLHRN